MLIDFNAFAVYNEFMIESSRESEFVHGLFVSEAFSFRALGY